MCWLEIIPVDLLKQDPQLILTGLWHLELLSFSALILFLFLILLPFPPHQELLGTLFLAHSLSHPNSLSGSSNSPHNHQPYADEVDAPHFFISWYLSNKNNTALGISHLS